MRRPQSPALLYVGLLNAGMGAIAVGLHKWLSACFWIGLTIAFAISSFRRSRSTPLDPWDYRTQVRLSRRFAAGGMVWGLVMLFSGTPGHRGHIVASGILVSAFFFALALLFLSGSLFWNTARGQARLLSLRDRAEVKTAARQVEADAAAMAETARWKTPPYFGE
jgi:hypothetical protein